MKQPLDNDRPTASKTEDIEVSQERVKLRIALLIVVFAVTLISLSYGFSSLFSTEPGVTIITALSSGSPNCGGDFTFYYNLGQGSVSATAEQKAIKKLYSKTVTDAYRLFNADTDFEGCVNLWYIKEHVNEEITVDPALYEAFVLLAESNTRYHYLAPVYEIYQSLFMCENDFETLEFDPFLNAELREFYAETVGYINNPDDISLELLGDNVLCLRVSDDYLNYAGDNGINRFIDFFWMKNGFISDYIAGVMLENGYTRGTLISYDGFAINLDDTTEFSYTLYRRDGVVISAAETLRFTGPVSIVYLHDYPLGNGDGVNYYVREDGAVRFPFIDTADGMCKSASPELAASSKDMGCAEIMLRLVPLYVTDAINYTALQALTQEGITTYLYE